ncbi:hypothetical protein ACF3NR_11215 [Vaginella massiliensis]|uniref:hypothetical protein n=1 Tax=Vaginella massiliensis TaxID=1816680 RepID=UPI0008395D0F|nr:hypothetical protein [Vaginella massiliensis]
MKKYITLFSLVFLFVFVIDGHAQTPTNLAQSHQIQKNVDNLITLDGNWVIKKEKNTFYVYGSSITNHSLKPSSYLKLTLYLLSEEELNNSNFGKKNKIGDLNVGRIGGNGSKIQNVYIQFEENLLKKFESGTYYPVLKLNSNLADIKILNAIDLNDGKIEEKKMLATTHPSDRVNETTATQEINKVEFAPIEYRPFYLTVVKLEGQLQLNIDYKNFMVNLGGEEALLKNISSSSSKPIRLRLSLVENYLPGVAAKGYNVAEFEVDPLEAGTALTNFTFKSSLQNLVPKGSYNPIIQVVEKENNHYIFNSIYIFDKKLEIN